MTPDFRLHDYPALQRLVDGPRKPPRGLTWRPPAHDCRALAILPGAARSRLIAAAEAGTTHRVLAQRFGISRRAVGLLVRRDRGR